MYLKMWHTPNDNFHRDVNEESNIGGNNGTFQRITSAKAFGCHWIISSHRMVPSSEMWMLIYNPLELYVYIYIYITNMNQLSQHIIPLAIDISWYITNKPVVAIVIGLICTNFANDVFPRAAGIPSDSDEITRDHNVCAKIPLQHMYSICICICICICIYNIYYIYNIHIYI